MGKLLRDLARVEAQMKNIQMKLMQLSAKKRVLKEAVRAAERKKQRALLKQHKQGKAKLTKKTCGRRPRWPGKRVACCRRHLNLPGGSPHSKSLCAATQAWLKKGECF